MKKTEKLYNRNIKEEFLNQYDNKATRLIALYPLRKAQKYEEMLGKDLYEMNLKEIEEVLYSLSSSSRNAIYTNVIKIEEYLGWASRNGHRRTNISPLPKTNREEWMSKFVADYRNYSFNRREISNMLEELVNDVDRALLLLLFEGARGKQYSEVTNLKESDISISEDGEPELTLTNSEGERRVMSISEELSVLLRRANRQRDYINKNGDIEDEHYLYSEFAQSEYIFKRTTRGRQGGKLDNFFVNRKIALFKEVFDMPYLKASHIIESGMVYMAHKIQENNGVLSAEGVREIAEKYDTAFTMADGKRYRNLTTVRRIIEKKEHKDSYEEEIRFDF